MEFSPKNEGSILDKVLAVASQESLLSFDPVEVVSRLFNGLSEREQDILRRRFGLHGQEPETLEGIGKGYNVTRERIRQIENSTIRSIKNRRDFADLVKPVESVILTCLERHGGIMAHEHLLEVLLQAERESRLHRNHLVFILEKITSDRVESHDRENLKEVWKIKFVDWDKIEQTLQAIREILEREQAPLPEEELLRRFRETEVYKEHEKHYGLSEENYEPIHAHLRAASVLKKNPFGQWGLSHWSTVTPKRMGDKIYLVLKQSGSPMHFRNITEEINKAGFDRKKAYPPTVHNELILDKRYVLVGRGIYALTEWGYIPGVVSDVIAAVLRESGSLSRDEIVNKVLQQRLVKRGTIYLALSSNQKFVRAQDGRYRLVEEANAPA